MTAVSIILPFYNSAPTFEECLESILAQSFSDFELLAIDDGSIDDSALIAQKYSDLDRRITLLQPGRIGLVAALNLGLSRASGALIARMDADDVMCPERLEAQSAYLADHPEIALVSCLVRVFPESTLRDGFREYEKWLNSCVTPREIADNLYVESPHAHPSVMFRRDVVVGLGGYRSGDFPEDYELWLRMAEAGYGMAKVPKVLLHWRDREERLSRNDARYSDEAFSRLRARYLARDPRLQPQRELVLWGAGRSTRKRAAHLLQRGMHHSAWIDIDLCKVGNTVGGRKVHLPQWLNRKPRPFVLVYVNNHGARDEIAMYLESIGYLRGQDYLSVG